MPYSDNDMFTYICPNILPYVRFLLLDGRVGICDAKFNILDLKSSLPSLTTPPQCDRFKLSIPYASHTLTWEVLFDSNCPDEPPDFIFGPEDEDFYPYLEDVHSLVNWNPDEAASLLHVVTELLHLYQQYQQRLILQNSRLQFEYTSLLESEIPQDSIEILALKKGESLGPVHFLVDLCVDFSNIPAYLTKDNPGHDSAVLLITFTSADQGKVTPQLYLSPRVDRCLGGAANTRIPPYPKDSCLLDYVPGVKQILTNKIEQIVTTYEKKRDYVSAFLSHFGRSIIQYDAETFSKISFLFEWNDFFFMTTINMPSCFPLDQPIIRFQSVYHVHESNKRPYSKSFADYPYSPRWSGHEMAERARAFILENIKGFQVTSVNKGIF